MANFIVTTDSGCDLPIEMLKSRDIFPLFMTYEINGELVSDTMRQDDLRNFYRQMREGAVPHTSQVNQAEFLEFWRPFARERLPIIHISMGSGISGTYENGLRAIELLKAEIPDSKIFLVDSTLASVGYGMLALEAASMRDAGATPDQCLLYLNAIKGGINTWYTTSDLTYLYRSGRVSRAGMAVAHALGICPLLNLDAEGRLVVRERVRGAKSAARRLNELIGICVIQPESQILYICHSDIEARAREFGEALRAEYGFRDVFCTYIGATIGAHAGPGLMAAFFSGRPR